MRSQIFAYFGAFLLLGTSTANADFLISPRGGTVLWEGGEDVNGDLIFDPQFTVNSLGAFTGRFYGAPVGAIQVSENGNLNLGVAGASDYFPLSLATTPFATIAPLWDDFLVLPGADNAVIDHSISGQFLAITWENVRLELETAATLSFDPTQRSAQVVWFEAPMTIRGTSFQADDIVFSYVGDIAGTSQFGDLYATVGITNGSGTFTAVPGSATGFHEAADSSLLAWENDSFIRFRFINGSYVSTKEFLTAVPEPSSIVLFGIGVAGCWQRSRKRHIAKLGRLERYHNRG